MHYKLHPQLLHKQNYSIHNIQKWLKYIWKYVLEDQECNFISHKLESVLRMRYCKWQGRIFPRLLKWKLKVNFQDKRRPDISSDRRCERIIAGSK